MTDSTYAIIQLGGKQHMVHVGDKFEVNRLTQADNEEWTTSDVLLVSNGKDVSIGAPLVEKASVSLKHIKQTRREKIRVATYKAKSRYRKVKGHKQPLSLVEVVSIQA